MNNNFLYIRVIKELIHTVLVVGQRDKTRNGFNGQKKYYDNFFKKWVGFAGGSTVKRHIVERFMGLVGEQLSPVIFQLKKVKGEDELREDIVINTCNPLNMDQHLRGYMLTTKDQDTTNVKRRSPLSISALTPVHPLLASCYGEMGVVDRSNVKGNKITIIGENGKQLESEEVKRLLGTKNGSKLANHRKLIDSNGRMSGIYEMTMAINLDRLFSVELNEIDSEVTPEVESQLRENGWKEEHKNGFNYLVAPKEYQDKIVKNLADAIINFRVFSNQSSTFSAMPVLAVSVTKEASKLHKGIVARITKGSDTDANSQSVALQINEVDGLQNFISSQMAKYVLTDKDDVMAEENAVELITDMLRLVVEPE